MFRKLFGRNKKSNTPKKAPSRDLFEEFFPLTTENKSIIDEKLQNIQLQMFGEEGLKKMQGIKRIKDQKNNTFHALSFDTLGWNLEEEKEEGLFYGNEYGDYLKIDRISANGKLEKNKPSELAVYRNWVRNMFVEQDGGLIMCEELLLPDKFDAFESIGKTPRKNTTGIDYTYFLNIRNYEEQKLYQLIIRTYELGTTGLRDNMTMHPLCDIAKMDMGELSELYRKDPYDKTFKGGNRMNLAEMEAFDHLFPFHPLSAIRQEIRPRLLSTINFV